MENEIHLCDYGCGQVAIKQFKNGKWCCQKSHNQCPTQKKSKGIAFKTNRRKRTKFCVFGCGLPAIHLFQEGWCCNHKKNLCPNRIEIYTLSGSIKKHKREKPEFCDYGCGKEPKYYFESLNKWCCCENYRSCPKIRKNNGEGVKKANNKFIFEIIENPDENVLCSYGCGKIALYGVGIKKLKPCCSKYYSQCSAVSSKNKESNTGKESYIRTDEWRNNQSIRMTKFMLSGNAKYLNTLNVNERKEKARKTREKNGDWVKIEDLSSFELYRIVVGRFTYQSANQKYTKEELKQRGNNKDLGQKHIDHLFSVSEGFHFGILPSIIGSKSNIELVCCKYNLKKWKKCDITLEELFKRYDEEIKGEHK